MADGRGVRAPAAAPPVHARLCPEPSDALPAFKRRCAPADQVDSLRCLVGGPYVPDRHGGFVYPPIGDLVCRGLTVVVGPHRVCGATEYYVSPHRHRLRRPQVPPLRHRSHHHRTLVYGSLSLSLVALYFGGIVVLQRVFVVLTGERSTLAVVAST